MSNSVSFVGRLGRDSELKPVGDSNVLEFSVANDVGFGDKQSTNWFRCSLWGKQAVSLEPYLLKGKQVFISGELSLRPWMTKDDVERISPDVRVNTVKFCGDKKDADQSSSRLPAGQDSENENDESGDDLPF